MSCTCCNFSFVFQITLTAGVASPTPKPLIIGAISDDNDRGLTLVEDVSNHVSEDISTHLNQNSLENAQGVDELENELERRRVVESESQSQRSAEARPLRRGVLRVRITEFLNPANKDADGDCCMDQNSGYTCGGYCRLFFR